MKKDIVAVFDIPPWDNSAMDGYAVRFSDIQNSSSHNPTVLNVIEDLPAGSLPKKVVGPAQAARIMTGAPLPQGADTVVRQEDTSFQGSTVRILIPPEKGANVRKAGENIAKGDCVIQKGTVLHPAHIGLLASLSRSYVLTYQTPTVGILRSPEWTSPPLTDFIEQHAQLKHISRACIPPNKPQNLLRRHHRGSTDCKLASHKRPSRVDVFRQFKANKPDFLEIVPHENAAQ